MKIQNNYKTEQMKVVTLLLLILLQSSNYLEQFVDGRNAIWYVIQITYSIVYASIGLTFMLSGYENLEQFEEKRNEKIGQFYLNKLIYFGLPFLIVNLILYIQNCIRSAEALPFWMYIIDFPMKLLTGQINGSFWFIYYLIGAWVITPFLGIMLAELSDWELSVFTIISFVIQTVITVVYFTKYTFSFQVFLTFGLMNWLFYYIFGYTLKRLHYRRLSAVKAVVVFFAAVLLAVVEKRFSPISNPYVDNQHLTMMLTCMALFCLFHDTIRLPGRRLIFTMARGSILAYLIHPFVLTPIIGFNYWLLGDEGAMKFLVWIFSWLGTFILTSFIGVLLDHLVFRNICDWIRDIVNPSRRWKRRMRKEHAKERKQEEKEKKARQKLEEKERKASEKARKEAEKKNIKAEEKSKKNPVKSAAASDNSEDWDDYIDDYESDEDEYGYDDDEYEYDDEYDEDDEYEDDDEYEYEDDDEYDYEYEDDDDLF